MSMLFTTNFTLADATDLRQLVQLAEYISVDYGAAVVNGEVINTDEYQEMQEFANLIQAKISELGVDHNNLNLQAETLISDIGNKASVEQVSLTAATLGQALLVISPKLILPKSLLPIAKTKQVFEAQCASCHGVTGAGDGVLAAQLDPTPTNFTDKSRALNRSLLGLYGAISNGIEGTAMTAFVEMNDQERWSLAFMVGGLAFEATADYEFEVGNRASKEDFVRLSPKTLYANQPGLSKVWLEGVRTLPEHLFNASERPLDVTRRQLGLAFIAYKKGQYKEARTLSVSAYLDGFELIENNLDAKDKVLRKKIESKLLGLRKQFTDQKSAEDITPLMARIYQQLDEADALLRQSSLSNGALFSASFIILLREGLEALLVVIALTTVLIRSNRRDALRYVHAGWVGAIAAGLVTWGIAQTVVAISGASREVMEGVAALVAAIVLFYVGFWMHSKTHANHWQEYIQSTINKQLQTGTLWGIAGLSFIAVYREVFETVLFYQSLLTQTAASQYPALGGGFALAVVTLAGLAWAMIYYSQKLPIAKFFSSTAYLLLALSFVLMGKAISALQEAALIGISKFPVQIEFDWLGIAATWEGLGAQGLVIALSIFLILKGRYSHN